MTIKVTGNGIPGEPIKFNRNRTGTTETMLLFSPGSPRPEKKELVLNEIPSTCEIFYKNG
jgi:hypothetical protein